MMLRYLFPHPFPKSFDWVQIGAVTGQLNNFYARFFSCTLYPFTPMPGSAVPNNNNLALLFIKPLDYLVEIFNGMVTIASSFSPDETISFGEVVSAVPVNPSLQRRGGRSSPGGLTNREPAIAQLQVLMQMRFVNIDYSHFFPPHLLKKQLDLLDKFPSLVRVGFGQQLPALFPT